MLCYDYIEIIYYVVFCRVTSAGLWLCFFCFVAMKFMVRLLYGNFRSEHVTRRKQENYPPLVYLSSLGVG